MLKKIAKLKKNNKTFRICRTEKTFKIQKNEKNILDFSKNIKSSKTRSFAIFLSLLDFGQYRKRVELVHVREEKNTLGQARFAFLNLLANIATVTRIALKVGFWELCKLWNYTG